MTTRREVSHWLPYWYLKNLIHEDSAPWHRSDNTHAQTTWAHHRLSTELPNVAWPKMRSWRKSILIAIYCADTETVFVAEQSVEHKQIPEQDESCQILITRVSNMVSKSNEAHTQQTVGSAPNWKSPSPCCHPARDEPKKRKCTRWHGCTNNKRMFPHLSPAGTHHSHVRWLNIAQTYAHCKIQKH